MCTGKGLSVRIFGNRSKVCAVTVVCVEDLTIGGIGLAVTVKIAYTSLFAVCLIPSTTVLRIHFAVPVEVGGNRQADLAAAVTCQCELLQACPIDVQQGSLDLAVDIAADDVL